MKNNKLREEIVITVSSFCRENKLDYRSVWKIIYNEYENRYKIPVTTWYKLGSNSKLDFLEDYEELYKTLSKLKELIKEAIYE